MVAAGHTVLADLSSRVLGRLHPFMLNMQCNEGTRVHGDNYNAHKPRRVKDKMMTIWLKT